MRQPSNSLRKRLSRLEQSRRPPRYVGGWPPIEYDVDKWSAMAEESQQALVLKAQEHEKCAPRRSAPSPADRAGYDRIQVELPIAK